MDELAIFTRALDIEHADERAIFLQQACGEDAALRARIEALLLSHEAAGRFLQGSPLGVSPATIDTPPYERPGTTIGPYKLLKQIGEGGMGTVYLAEQTEPVQRKVALKVIKPGMDTHQVIARFEAERQALAMMDHVNIARVLDAGTTDAGRPYFVMELVHGVPITKYCDDNHLTPRQRLELFVPVCQAIQHAHQKGIIHRDIKPSNVMVTLYDGQPVPKVIDFGVAKATAQKLTERTLFTQFGTMVGTLEYMSPEQAEMSALGIDTRSDIYSLGVLLYELLTGSTPLSSKRMKEAAYAEILRMIKEEEPPRPSTRLTDSGEALASISAQRHTEPAKLAKLVRGELDWIVMKTLEKDRNRRYETANAFAADVQRYLADEPVQACPPSVGYRFGKFARRNKTVLATTAVIALSLIAGVVGTTWQAIEATRERDRAVLAEGLAQRRLESEQRERQRAEFAESQAKDEAKRADAEAATAKTEAAIAVAVNLFLTDDLLAQANPENEPDRDIMLRTILDRAAEKIGGRFADQPLVEAAIRNMIGQTYVGLGLPEAAQPHFERAIQLRHENLGADHRDTLAAIYGLAWTRWHQGHFQEAASSFLKILDLQRRVLGEEHSETLSTMTALGTAYKRFSKSGEAEPLYVKALEIRRRVLGETHLDTATSLHHLAMLYFETRRSGEGESLCLQALAIRQRALGDEHPDTIFAMHTLAAIYRNLGRFADAEHLTFKTYALRRRVLGEEHPQTLTSMHYLGQLYSVQGRFAEGEEWFHKALEGRRRKLGPNHLETIETIQRFYQLCLNRGVSLVKSGQWDQAMVSFTQAIDLNPKTIWEVLRELRANGTSAGVESLVHQALAAFEARANQFPTQVSYQKGIADVRLALGNLLRRTQPQEAEKSVRQAVDIYEKLAAERPDEANIRPELAKQRVELARLSRANAVRELQQWDIVVDDYSKAIELNPSVSSLWLERADCHLKIESWDEAIADCTKAIDLDPGTFDTVYFGLRAHGKSAEAEKPLRQALAALERRAAEFPAVVSHRKSLARVQNRLGILLRQTLPQEAEKFHRQAIAIFEQLVSSFPADPEYREALGDCYRLLFFCLGQTIQSHERERLLRRALTQLEDALAGAPQRQFCRFITAETYLLLGDVLLAQQRTAEAEALYRKAINAVGLLTAQFLVEGPNIAIWRRQVEGCFVRLIQLLTAANRVQEAQQVHQQAITLYEKLATEQPEEPYFGQALAKHQAALAKLKEKK